MAHTFILFVLDLDLAWALLLSPILTCWMWRGEKPIKANHDLFFGMRHDINTARLLARHLQLGPTLVGELIVGE